MKRFITILSVMVVLGIASDTKPALAAMTPQEILARADQARGNVEGIEWKVKINSIENGRKRSQTIRLKVRSFNVLAESLSPPKVKGRKILMIDRNMWFIQPGLRKPVPISPRQKLQGGASNGDIASTNYAEDYEAVSLSEDSVDGEPCTLFDLKATSKKATYDRIKYWISKERFVGVQAEFFTVFGKVLKSATFEYENSLKIRGALRPFISKMVITDAVVKENITTMTYSKPKLKRIPDSAFNLNLLVR